jgi:AraC-like DNA-binding protein
LSTLSEAGKYRFIRPTPALRRYITAYYFFELDAPDGHEMEDVLHPEWASARFLLEGNVDASIVPHPPATVPLASITGPTLRACYIRFGKAKMAGIGLLPLGWHHFIGIDASKRANQVFDVAHEPAFSLFDEIWQRIGTLRDAETIATVFDTLLSAALNQPDTREVKIEAFLMALTNPDMANVAQLAEALDMESQRVERMSRWVFGFPPKRLLRRQRFLRSLGVRLLDPELRWTSAMDVQYHDQAHFTRDFHDFMGMSPRAYLAMPRPISRAAIHARTEALGQPLQVLQRPGQDDGR